MRIRRDTGPTHGLWTHKEIAYGITSLPPDLAGPRHLGIYARQHWVIENRKHYVRDKTFSEDLQQVRTGNQPNAYAAIRNLVTGAFRRAGTPTSPTPAAITAATTSASSPSTDTPDAGCGCGRARRYLR
jgi:hypothetical protein